MGGSARHVAAPMTSSAGERSFGPVLMYFVMGAMIFSAYALLGTPQRVVAKGPDAFYMLAYGAAAFVPVFYLGARVRRRPPASAW